MMIRSVLVAVLILMASVPPLAARVVVFHEPGFPTIETELLVLPNGSAFPADA